MGEARMEKRVGGWLLFLCIWLVILRGLSLFAAITEAVITTDSHESLLMFLFVLLFGYGLSAGIVLWSRARWAVTYARVYFLLQPILMGFLWRLYATTFSNVGPDVAGQTTTAVASSLVGSVVWFLYLTFSKRVKNTFEAARSGKKSVVLAFFLGAALGPFATLYFGVAAFVAVLLSWLASVGILALLGFGLPTWVQFVWLPFNAIACAVMAAIFNEEQGQESGTIVGLAGSLIYTRWMIRVGLIIAGINDVVRFIGAGKWGAAIFTVLLGIPAAIWIADWIVMLVQGIAGGLAALIESSGKKHKRDSSTQELGTAAEVNNQTIERNIEGASKEETSL